MEKEIELIVGNDRENIEKIRNLICDIEQLFRKIKDQLEQFDKLIV